MLGNTRLMGGITGGDKARIREKAMEVLRDSNLTAVFEAAGVEDGHETAGAALKAVLAERMAEYAMNAMEVARKKRLKFGAAAIIIAAQKG